MEGDGDSLRRNLPVLSTTTISSRAGLCSTNAVSVAGDSSKSAATTAKLRLASSTKTATRAAAAVVLEPTLGATVKKTALRVVGTILAGVAGLAILYIAGAGAGGFSYTLHPTAMAAVVTAFTAAAGAVFMLLVGGGSGCWTRPNMQTALQLG